MKVEATPPRKRAPGGGMKADDGPLELERKQVKVDAASEAILLRIGGGNFSLGVREAARRLAEHDDLAPFEIARHQARKK